MKHPGISIGSDAKQLQRLLDNLPVGVVVHGSDTSVLQCNPAATKILGLTAEQMTGKQAIDPVWKFAYEDLSPMSMDDYPVNRVISSGETLTDYLLGIIRHDRDYITWVIVNAIPVFTKAGILEEVIVNFSDITTRKHIEEELKASESKFRTMYDNAPLSYQSLDSDGCFLDVNPTWLNTLGYKREEIIGQNFADFLHPDYQPHFEKNFPAFKERGYVHDVQFKIRHNDNRYLDINLEGCIGYNRDGSFARTYCVFQDITSRKQAEAALRESEAKFRFLSENMSDIIWTVDMKFRTTYVSPSVESILGFTQEERLAQSPEEMITPESLKTMRKLFAKELIRERLKRANPIKSIVFLTEYYKKDGSTLWVENHARWIRNDKGKATGIHGISRDITDRRQGEEKLRKSEEKFRSIFENRGTATGIYGDDRIITDCNSVFTEMCGYSKTEIIGNMKWSDFVVEEDLERMQKYHEQRTKKGLPPPSQYECRINRTDGTVRNVIVNIALTGNIRIVSLVDVTDRKKAEEEVLRMQRLEGLGTIAGGIAHDFNNLLTGVFTNIEMAKIELPRNSPSASYLQGAYDAIHSARQLTGQLLTFAKGSAPVLSTVDTSALVQDTVSFNLRGSNINTEIILQEGLWAINADKGQIGQILANLLINARQSMPGGGTLHVDGRNICAGDQVGSPDPLTEYVCITIRDEGTGIPAKIIDHIFDPYFSTKDTGHGLGLAIVHSIIEQHDGSISVTSETNIGTTVNVFLPAVPASEAEDIVEDSHDDTASNDSPSLRVLLMDDEEILRKVGRLLIERLGHTIDTAVDGVEALHKYILAMEIGNPFDLVIMDLTIRGGKGGQETMRELLEIDPKVRAIVSSGYASDPIMADCTAHGFSGRLAKPFTMQDLEREIIRVMGID